VSDPRAFGRATGWRPAVTPADGIGALHDWLVQEREHAVAGAA
jgi:hypothetical protein